MTRSGTRLTLVAMQLCTVTDQCGETAQEVRHLRFQGGLTVFYQLVPPANTQEPRWLPMTP